jgi:hypothetical protein
MHHAHFNSVKVSLQSGAVACRKQKGTGDEAQGLRVKPGGGGGGADESKQSLSVVRIHLTNLRFPLRFVRR